MPPQNEQPEPEPVTSLSDPRAISLLTTEHWSQLSARSLAYNEAFARGGMFLTFLSMSFVALALLSSAMSFGDQFATVAAIVLAFDFIIGLTTYFRIMGANADDLRSVHAMARLRHAYTEIAPIVDRYFTSPTHTATSPAAPASMASTAASTPPTIATIRPTMPSDVVRPYTMDARLPAGGP